MAHPNRQGSVTVRMALAARSDGLPWTTTRDASPGQAGSAGGLAEISFGSQQRQREITRCALSVEGSESATVIRSTSVVLSWITLSEGLMATLTLGLLGH